MTQAPSNGYVESVGEEVHPCGSVVSHLQTTIDDRIKMLEDHITAIIAYVRDAKESVAVVSVPSCVASLGFC